MILSVASSIVIELHMFSDVSSTGYGAVRYLRVKGNGKVHVSIMMGKSRIAPIKVVTIPRLELAAAVVSVKLAQQILKELEFRVNNTIYHTDSSTVLHYLNNSKARFPVYVANRVKMIHDYTQPSQWKYVNTKNNPADFASRGANGNQVSECSL